MAAPPAAGAQPPHDKPALEVRYKGLLTIALIGATLLQVLDTTIANVALPHMQAALGASQDSISWVLTSYIIGTAVVIPITGWLADQIGQKTLLLLSVGGFILASMLCGIAVNLPEMVAFRILQGVSGAFIVPLVQSLLYDINPPSQQGRAVALFGQGIMVGPVIGPILGGYLTENYDWRWVFFINVPIGAACLVMLFFLLPANRRRPRHIDLFGFFTLALALGGLQLFLDRGERIEWFEATETWITVSIMVAATWVYVIHQATAKRPLYPRGIFQDRNVVVGAILMVTLGIVTMSAMALLPPMLQRLMGYPVEEAGLVLAPRGLGTIIAMFFVGRIAGRVDTRLLLAAGFLATAFTMGWMSRWSLDVDSHEIMVCGFIQGAGMAFVFVPLNLVSFATIDLRLRTDAVSLIVLMRNMGQSIGITIMTVLLTRSTSTSHAYLSEYTTPQNLSGLTQGIVQGVGQPAQAALAMLEAEIERQALMIAYLNDFHIMMLGSLLALPLLLLARKPKARATSEDMLME